MGQYHILVNLTKKQFIHPHQIGNGLKLREQIGDYSTATALAMLIAASSGRGGGDFQDNPLVGSWAGDQIAFIGDYALKTDLKGVNAKLIYDAASWVAHGSQKNGVNDCYRKNRPRFMAFARQWTNISDQVRDMMAAQFNIKYTGTGWLDISQNGTAVRHHIAPDLIISAA